MNFTTHKIPQRAQRFFNGRKSALQIVDHFLRGGQLLLRVFLFRFLKNKLVYSKNFYAK